MIALGDVNLFGHLTFYRSDKFCHFKQKQLNQSTIHEQIRDQRFNINTKLTSHLPCLENFYFGAHFGFISKMQSAILAEVTNISY